MCGSLREAVISLNSDRKFLTEGGVFFDDQIDAYIDLKMEEIHNFDIHLTLLSFKCIIAPDLIKALLKKPD